MPHTEKFRDASLAGMFKAANPDSTRLLNLRLGVFFRLNLLENAQKDTDRLIALTDDTSYNYLACALAESLGNGEKEEYLQCYRDVYALRRLRVKAIDAVHVLAASMGEMPDAEKLRTDYLQSISDEPLQSWSAVGLVPFEREKFLYRVK